MQIENPKKENMKFVIKMLIALLLSFWILTLTSCDITKDIFKTKEKSKGKETIETITKRIGDTVTYMVPVIRYKDTTIYTVNKQGTTLRTIYNSEGQIASIDCFASAIEEIKRENREFQNSLIDKEKHKTEKANFDWVIYIVMGLVVIITVALILAFIWLKQQSTIIKNIT